MPDLHLVAHGNGDYSIGAEIDGAYIPFVTVAAAKVKHFQERAATLDERAESADPEEQVRVQAAHDSIPTSIGKSSAEPEPESAREPAPEPSPAEGGQTQGAYEQGGGELA